MKGLIAILLLAFASTVSAQDFRSGAGGQGVGQGSGQVNEGQTFVLELDDLLIGELRKRETGLRSVLPQGNFTKVRIVYPTDGRQVTRRLDPFNTSKREQTGVNSLLLAITQAQITQLKKGFFLEDNIDPNKEIGVIKVVLETDSSSTGNTNEPLNPSQLPPLSLNNDNSSVGGTSQFPQQPTGLNNNNSRNNGFPQNNLLPANNGNGFGNDSNVNSNQFQSGNNSNTNQIGDRQNNFGGQTPTNSFSPPPLKDVTSTQRNNSPFGQNPIANNRQIQPQNNQGSNAFTPTGFQNTSPNNTFNNRPNTPNTLPQQNGQPLWNGNNGMDQSNQTNGLGNSQNNDLAMQNLIRENNELKRNNELTNQQIRRNINDLAMLKYELSQSQTKPNVPDFRRSEGMQNVSNKIQSGGDMNEPANSEKMAELEKNLEETKKQLAAQSGGAPITILVWLMLFVSGGFNVYLWWLWNASYSRYQELADDLRQTFTQSGG